MGSLLNALAALNAPSPRLSVRPTIAQGFWPEVPRDASSGRSLQPFLRRFSQAGANLRSLASGTRSAWRHIDRTQLVSELRDRLRDPAIIRQDPTGLCGPLAIIMELARRNPAEYVRAAQELFETGKFNTLGGDRITAEEELRHEPVASGDIGQADWLLAATMRDDANFWEDIDDDANGLESITLWNEMSYWTSTVLGLQSFVRVCFSARELNAFRLAHAAITLGGVAFLLVDSNLIRDGGSDREEDMWWQDATHTTSHHAPALSASTRHSKDDTIPPDHWVTLLSVHDFSGEQDPIRMRVWCWGREFEIHGTAEAFTEYLYAVVTGIAARRRASHLLREQV